MTAASLLRLNGKRPLRSILQTESAECGLACLAMVADFHGYRTDLNALRRRVSTSRGVTLRDLISYAASLQLVGRPLRLDLEELRALTCPAILHWDLNHFVVLAKATRRHVVIHDPASGRKRLPLQEVGSHFTGVALELAPGVNFRPANEVRKLKMRDLWSSSRGLGSGLGQLLLLSLALQVFAIATPFYSQLVVDEALVKQDAHLLTVLATGFLLVALIQVAVTALRSYASLYLGNSVGFQISANLFRHLIRLPLAYFERRQMGDLVSRFGSLNTVRSVLTEGIISGVLDGLMSIGSLAMMYVYSPRLTLVVVASFGIFLLFRVLRIAFERARLDEYLLAQAKQQTLFMESARAILSIKSFGRENERENIWQNALADETNGSIGIARFGIGVSSVNGLLSGIENIAVIYLAGHLVLDNALTIGMFFAFISYKGHFTRAMQSLTATVTSFCTLNLHLARIADIAFTPRELGFDDAPAAPPKLQGSLIVQELSYRYAANEAMILSKVECMARPGEFVALIGPSGCGKSTLMKLMMGLFEPLGGKVLIDGRKLRDFGLQNYRARIGAVLQGDLLLSGSIAENISFFSHKQSLARVEECARIACVHDEIMAMPMKYDSQVGDMGARMSYGQRQRILIARALYSGPRILFMDEATSHIDLQSERQILASMKGMGVTMIVISHRPEVLDLADRVIAVANGAATTLRPIERPGMAVHFGPRPGDIRMGATLSDGSFTA